MQISNTIYDIPNELKLTLFIKARAAEEYFLSDKISSYTLFYSDKIYKVRESILNYSDYLSNYFKTDPGSKELTLKFKYATSIQALDIVMKLLFGFKDVLIPNNEYIQVLAFLEELSNYIFSNTLRINDDY